jgi:aldehyde:ferredoxin oxidoreductase
MFRRSIPDRWEDPGNIVAISSGLFSGTGFPSSGRTTIAVLKSPVTGFFGDGNLGGHFGPALRLAGVDALVITGKSPYPCFFRITKAGGMTIHDAQRMWNYGASTTELIIQREWRTNHKVLTIGQGGAQGVFSSVVICENRTAGGGGTGAVLGSKGVKAIAVEYDPDMDLCYEEREDFERAAEAAKDKIESHPVFDTFKRYGTTSLIEIHQGLKYLPTLNWRKKTMKKWKKVSGQTLLKKWIKENPDYESGLEDMAEDNELGCRNCPIVCSNPDKIEYETLNCLGPKIGIDDLDKILTLNMVYMNDAGLDVIQTTSVISALMEMSQLGIIDYEFKWGDYTHIDSFLKDLIRNPTLATSVTNPTIGKYFRSGFKMGLYEAARKGKIKIDFKKLDKHTGQSALSMFAETAKALELRWAAEIAFRHFYIGTKGMGMSGVFPSKANKGVALAVATSSRGADHLLSLPTLATYASWYIGKENWWKQIFKYAGIPFRALFVMKADAKHLYGDLYKTYQTTFGVPGEICREWENLGFLTNQKKSGWGSMIKFTQEMYAVSDAVSMCRFTSPWRFGVGPRYITPAIKALIGYDLSWRLLLTVGERIYALERDLLYYYGATVEDSLPKRFFKGRGNLTRSEFNELIMDYYDRCSYDVQGRPLSKRLTQLTTGIWGDKEYEFYQAVVRARTGQGT